MQKYRNFCTRTIIAYTFILKLKKIKNCKKRLHILMCKRHLFRKTIYSFFILLYFKFISHSPNGFNHITLITDFGSKFFNMRVNCPISSQIVVIPYAV